MKPASSFRSTPTPSTSASSSRSCNGAVIRALARPTPASGWQHRRARRARGACRGWGRPALVARMSGATCGTTVPGYRSAHPGYTHRPIGDMPATMTDQPTRSLTHLRALAHRYRLQLILALRVTVAALSALAIAQVLHLRLPLWAVLTSLIVTQMSLGRSLKGASDYLMGTLAGVAYGGAVGGPVPP